MSDFASALETKTSPKPLDTPQIAADATTPRALADASLTSANRALISSAADRSSHSDTQITVSRLDAVNHPAVEQSTDRLLNDSQNSALSGEQKAELSQSVREFLQLAREKNLSADEISRTLDATSRILEGKGEPDGKPLSAQDRAWLAESLMHNVAHPDRVDQGFHNTCNVTTISKRLMSLDPARVAEVVSSVALNGYYQAPDGARIKLDSKSLIPDSEAAGGETEDGKRNYASQVFAIAAINNYWQRRFPPHEYIQREPQGQGDTGERMIDFNGRVQRDSSGKPVDCPLLDCRAMIQIGREMGMKDNFLIANTRADAAAGALVDSAESLGNRLGEMQTQGKLPAVIFVRDDNKLFTGSYGGATGGWHVITVDHYDAVTGNVHICNQWGADDDRNVSLNLLYDATLPPQLWENCPGYLDRAQFERYHRFMASGGAGLDKNGVLTATEMEEWTAKNKKQLQDENPELWKKLYDLCSRLEIAEREHDYPTINMLMDTIDRYRQQEQSKH